MNLYENILKRLLTELRDAPILGEMPAGSVYYAMLYPKGNVVYLAAGPDGMPVSRTADSLNPLHVFLACLLYTSPSPRDVEESRMPSSA